MLPTLLCLATSRPHASQIVERLQGASVPTGDISILALPEDQTAPGSAQTTTDPAGAAKAAEGEKTTAGAAAGGIAGAAAGVGTMSIVGLTPLLILAPAIIGLGAVAGAAAGAVTGASTAGLGDYGIPEDRTEYFQDKLRAGGYIVAVRTEDEAALERAEAVFKETGGQDIALHRQTKKIL